ncbi:MAG: FAD-binding oxidoreductase [Thermoleophilia bacterium]|nr:FAD-binding oxidoreductase [Thermoleophilia bacterium]
MPETGSVVICGAGIVGTATAQMLARRGVEVTIVDRVGVAPAASGTASGFIALDWNDTTPLGGLARRSFELHGELREILDAEYGYQAVETVMAVGSESDRLQVEPGPKNPSWLDGSVIVRGVMGTHETTAQIDPRRFTEALMADAEAHGAKLVIGCVEDLDSGGPDGATRGVVVEGELMPADTVVVAMGPWTSRLNLPLPSIQGYKGASIILAADVPAQAVFSEFISRDGGRFSPEIYPRADGEVYVCGVPSDDPLPESAAEVTVDEADCEKLVQMAAAHSSHLADVEVMARQACFRPVTSDGLPLIGPIPGIPGAYVATGHGAWGILNAPATGEMLAEMILDGEARTVDPTPYRPERGLP